MVRRSTATLLVLTVIGSACTTPTETQALSLAEELGAVSPLVNEAVTSLFDTLDQSYDNQSQLFERLNDLRLPATFAILADKAGRIDAPPGTGAELERYKDFIAGLLFASESLDLAIATKDLTGTAMAAVTMEIAVGALAVALPQTSCGSLTPAIGGDLCDPGGLSGYEAGLDLEMRRFVASFRPAFRVSDSFGDVIRGSVLTDFRADAMLALDAAATGLGALDPDIEYIGLHDALLEYFPASAAAWSEPPPEGADPFIYGVIVDHLDEVWAATQLRLLEQHQLILTALPDSEIKSITGIWFSPRRDSVAE